MWTNKKKSLVLASICILICSVISFGMITQSYADTYPAWNSTTVYVGGNMVSYNGKVFKAKWWTRGETPGVAAVWELSGSGSTTPATPTTTPKPTTSTTPTTPTTGTYPAWESSKVYTGGTLVSYNGKNYKAQWWTQGETPGSASVWLLVSGGQTTPTQTPTTPTPNNNTTVVKPAEVPNDIWEYTMNADRKFGKNGDFALLLCAVIKKESNFGAGLGGSPSAGDGLMQVEPNTRNAYASKFSATFGHAYNHSSLQDQVYMGALILNEMIAKFGSIYQGLLHYNGGENWYPGAVDSYGRPILADQYANQVFSTYKSYGGKGQ
ncbi:MAG: carbohydrate-binding protein [Clostridia bacterium]|nr:carbohydrate-binding protein [Clostridia bacterium]